MTAQIRLECLRLSKPDVSMPDVDVWIDRAKALEAYVSGEGQGQEPPKKRRGRPPKSAIGNPATVGPKPDALVLE